MEVEVEDMEMEDMEVRVEEEEAEDILILTPTEVEEAVAEDLQTDKMMEDTKVTVVTRMVVVTMVVEVVVVTPRAGVDWRVRGLEDTLGQCEATKVPRPRSEAPPHQSCSPSLLPSRPSLRRPLQGPLPSRPWRPENAPLSVLPVRAQCWLVMAWCCSVTIISSAASWSSSLQEGRGNVSSLLVMSCWPDLRGKARI